MVSVIDDPWTRKPIGLDRHGKSQVRLGQCPQPDDPVTTGNKRVKRRSDCQMKVFAIHGNLQVRPLSTGSRPTKPLAEVFRKS